MGSSLNKGPLLVPSYKGAVLCVGSQTGPSFRERPIYASLQSGLVGQASQREVLSGDSAVWEAPTFLPQGSVTTRMRHDTPLPLPTGYTLSTHPTLQIQRLHMQNNHETAAPTLHTTLHVATAHLRAKICSTTPNSPNNAKHLMVCLRSVKSRCLSMALPPLNPELRIMPDAREKTLACPPPPPPAAPHPKPDER